MYLHLVAHFASTINSTSIYFHSICELAHTICVTSGVYIMLITFYGHPETLSKFPLPFDLTVAFAAPVTAVVQVSGKQKHVPELI